MKKKELIDFFEARKIINNNNKLLDFINGIKEDKWFPKIDDLEKDFDVLKKELKERRNQTNEAYKIYNSFICNCKHEISTYSSYSDFGPEEIVRTCLFCGKRIYDDTDKIWKESININSRYVSFLYKYDYYNNGYHTYHFTLKDAYSKGDVISLIKNILIDKEENEDIDLIEEFSKLNLINCNIVNKKIKPEYYVLIIGGFNTEIIGNNIEIYIDSKTNTSDFFNYFSDLLYTKIHVIENPGFIIDENNYNIQSSIYKNIEELHRCLMWASQDNVRFNLILDLSNLHTYSLINNQICSCDYELELEKTFPNVPIVRIRGVDANTLISGDVLKDEQLYLHRENEFKYYHLEDGNVILDNFDNTCKKIRKILKKK